MEEQHFLDPLNEPIRRSDFKEEQQELIQQVNNLKNYNWALLLLVLAILAPITVLLFMIIAKSFEGIYLLVYSLMPIAVHYANINRIQRQSILYLLCEKNAWAYSPRENALRPFKFSRLFPDVFLPGHEKKISNQVWGRVQHKTPVDFWYGNYSVLLEPNNRQNHSIFIIKLDKVLPSEFSLYRNSRKSEVKTESEEFNNLFNIIVTKHGQIKSEILNILSPSIQVRLIDFAKNFRPDVITFQHNCMIVVFYHNVWETKYTNFFKRVMIDERDVQYFDDLMKDMTALPSEMIKFLD